MDHINSSQEFSVVIDSWIRYFSEQMADAVHGMTEPCLVCADYENRTLELVYFMQPWMRNPAGVVHGGIIATLLDQSMGLLVRACAKGKSITPTVNLNVSYLRPARIGERMHVKAKALHVGSTLSTMTAEAFMEGEEGRTVASAAGTFYNGPMEGRLPVPETVVFPDPTAQE